MNWRLIDRWLPRARVERLLKTDLFDEAVAEGLHPLLRTRARCVVGIDVSPPTVAAAQCAYGDLEGHVADVRALPFPDGYFDAIVSNSTLDHFDALDSVGRALRELRRVLAPCGTLVITLDNRQNPIVAARTARPLRDLLVRSGAVPYQLGATCGPRTLSRLLREGGFDVDALRAVMHAPPRLLSSVAARLWGPRLATADYLRPALAAEHAGALPSRFLTAHFVAARAIAR